MVSGNGSAALLGSAATADTLALVQQTLRATNLACFMRAARFIAEAEMPPLAAGLTMPSLMVQREEYRGVHMWKFPSPTLSFGGMFAYKIANCSVSRRED